ncbi:MAG: LicD family protein, partial [Lachnospiraceae bacterium]|nr:LicD family protein [Lachnospiraceae bacterium]
MAYEDTLKELHEYELNALKAFTELCEKEDLTYYAIGGTLIGAVRHKGFIPWDDDVDVAMPRPDYDRFIKEFADKLPYPVVEEDYKRTQGFKSYFAKIRDDSIEVLETLTDNEND